MPSLAFIAPSEPESRDLLELTIRPAAAEAGYQIGAIDDGDLTEHSIGQPAERVTSADLLVADLTGARPNVMFALGVRYSSGRPVILLAPEGTGVPFDFVTRRIIFFDRSGRGLLRLRQDLTSSLLAAKNDVVSSSESSEFTPAILLPTTGAALGATLMAIAAMVADVIKRRRAQHSTAREVVELKELERRVESAASNAVHEVGPLLNEVAMTLMEQGDLDEAEIALRQALRLVRDSDTDASGALLSNLASLYARRGDREQAVHYYRQARSLLETQQDPHKAAQVTHNLAAEFTGSGDLDSADQLLRQSLATFREVGDRRSEAVALMNLAVLLADRGEQREAELNLGEAAELAAEVDDGRLHISILRALASLAAQNSDYGRAIDYLSQALSNEASQEDSAVRSALLRQMGDIALQLNDSHLAVQMFSEAVHLDRRSGDRRALGTSLSLLGAALAREGRVYEARSVLEEAIEELSGIAPVDGVRALTDSLARIGTLKG
jgi:tetratricopeptide (TPR) repeat protein